MFRGASQSVRRLHRAAGGSYNKLSSGRVGFLASSAVLASALWYSQQQTVHNDAHQPFTPEKNTPEQPFTGISPQNKSDTLTALVWGSNRASILSPLLPASVTVKKPWAPAWLNEVALRDLALHERHAACVDARGDVYQWGEGYASPGLDDAQPTRTLSGKNIVKLQLNENRVFALSKSGSIYVLDASASNQALTQSSNPAWWKFWASRQLVDFAELTPQSPFGWGEKFASISAGKDHLLALTSSGRAFSCPINKNANTSGQLCFDPPNLQGPTSVPISLASSSYETAVSLTRQPESDASAADLGIRFCTTLYEIPILKGIEFAQIVAGGRSSFARTPSGKVLAWGANEHGQLGLGAKSSPDSVKIPTEVVLWPTRAQQASTRCLDVSAGGDLTAFTIERAPTNEATTVDVLMCGDGQWGGLGNNSYSNGQATPVRVKTLSGLTEYNDVTQRLQCILPRSISISPSGHVLATLDPSSGGRDLLAWGKNQDYELGNGKKTGTASPMAVDAGEGRLLLQTKRATVRDLQGRAWGRGIKVEQFAVCGFRNSVVYWRTPV